MGNAHKLGASWHASLAYADGNYFSAASKPRGLMSATTFAACNGIISCSGGSALLARLVHPRCSKIIPPLRHNFWLGCSALLARLVYVRCSSVNSPAQQKFHDLWVVSIFAFAPSFTDGGLLGASLYKNKAECVIFTLRLICKYIMKLSPPK